MLFRKFISAQTVQKMQAAFQRMESSVEIIAYSLEQVTNIELLKNPAYTRFYENPQVGSWRQALMGLEFGDIGTKESPFAVPLSRFLKQYGLPIALFNAINERAVSDGKHISAVLAVFADLAAQNRRVDAVPFSINESTSEQNLLQLISCKKRIQEEQARIDLEKMNKEKRSNSRLAFFFQSLSVEQQAFIGTPEELNRFVRAPYFKFWDYVVTEKKDHSQTFIEPLVEFLRKHGVALSTFNDINEKLFAEKISLSYVVPTFDEIHAAGYSRIDALSVPTIIDWVLAMDAQEQPEAIEPFDPVLE